MRDIAAKFVLSQPRKFIKQEKVIELLRSHDDKHYVFDTTVDNIDLSLALAQQLKRKNNVIIFKGFYATLHMQRLLSANAFIDVIVNGFNFEAYHHIALGEKCVIYLVFLLLTVNTLKQEKILPIWQ